MYVEYATKLQEVPYMPPTSNEEYKQLFLGFLATLLVTGSIWGAEHEGTGVPDTRRLREYDGHARTPRRSIEIARPRVRLSGR